MRLHVTKFFKESSIESEDYRSLLSYKIYDFSIDMGKNSEFKLIRYTQIGSSFEVYKEF